MMIKEQTTVQRITSAKKILLIGLFLVSALAFQSCGSDNGPVPGVSGWYDSNWLYRQKITISSSMAPSDQTNFPMLIKITNQDNSVFAGAQANGDDILFISSDGLTKLDHEIESYSSTTTKEV